MRFRCGGEAKISCLPSDGSVVSAKLRNLSFGGICLNTSHPMPLGARAEVLICANAASFRTLGLVRAISEGSIASMEFVQMSAGSKDMLADLLNHLARVQRVMAKIRSGPVESGNELRRELAEAGVKTVLCGRAVPFIERISGGNGCAEETAVRTGEDRVVELDPLVINVDLFV
jgi:hypothetical protein